MIQTFVDKFMENKGILEEQFKKEYVYSYTELVKKVISVLSLSNDNDDDDDYDDDDDDYPDPERIHMINDGDYQGTLVYVIGERGYQPSTYWYVKIAYGSCSGCDTLQKINDYSDGNVPTDQQIADYMILALHIVQGIKLMGDDEV